MQTRNITLDCAAISSLVVAYALFIALAADGLAADFMPDDMMNAYSYEFKSVHQLLWDGLAISKGAYRPAGALFYTPLFAIFGFNSLPFRTVCFILLSLNLWLAFLVARAVLGSATAGALAALLFSYQAHFADLYYCSSTIYDLLSFFFFYMCFLCYHRMRRNGSVPGLRQCAGLMLLYLLALNSKENAAALPLVLLAHELTHLSGWPKIRFSPLRWLKGEGRLIVLLGMLAAAYMAPRVLGTATMASNPSYSPSLSLSVYTENLRHYARWLLYLPEDIDAVPVVTGYSAMAGLALLLRNNNLQFSWSLLAIASLPLMLIPGRGPFVLYVPYLGLSLYAAEALTCIWEWIRAHTPVLERWNASRRAIAFLCAIGILAGALYTVHKTRKPQAMGWVAPEQARVRRVLDVLPREPLVISKGARLLLLNSPFEKDDWAPLLLLRLYYRDETLQADWTQPGEAPPNRPDTHYDAVIEIP